MCGTSYCQLEISKGMVMKSSRQIIFFFPLKKIYQLKKPLALKKGAAVTLFCLPIPDNGGNAVCVQKFANLSQISKELWRSLARSSQIWETPFAIQQQKQGRRERDTPFGLKKQSYITHLLINYGFVLLQQYVGLDAFFHQIKLFIRFRLAFGLGLQTFYLINFS